jgi:hypothetical protein
MPDKASPREQIDALEVQLSHCKARIDLLTIEIRTPSTSSERKVDAVVQRDLLIAERQRLSAEIDRLAQQVKDPDPS